MYGRAAADTAFRAHAPESSYLQQQIKTPAASNFAAGMFYSKFTWKINKESKKVLIYGFFED